MKVLAKKDVCVCDLAEVSFNFEHERRIININYMLSGVCRGWIILRKDTREHKKDREARRCIEELQEERGRLNQWEGENWRRKGLTTVPVGLNDVLSNLVNLAAELTSNPCSPSSDAASLLFYKALTVIKTQLMLFCLVLVQDRTV